MTMNRYESYKDSGIQWLGEIPEHWKISRLKYEVTFNDEVLSDKTDLDYEILYIDISSVSFNQGIMQKEQMTFENSPSRARRIVKSGDVIVSTVRTYLKAIAQINNAEENLIVSTGFAVLRHKAELSPKFLGYWVQSENMINTIVAHSVGVSYPAINATDLVRLPIVKIPLPEQTAIADYLDNKLGEIDTLISKQETLLEKLAEQRTAIITHAVTKGLNAHAPMKNSGVAWLGDVPEHWEIKHSNQVFKIHNGATPKTSEPNYWGDEITWFTPKDLGDNQNKEISGSLKMITKEGYESCGVSLAPANSIALSKRAPIGHLAITTLPAVVNQGCFLLEVLKANNVNYLYYWLYANKVVLNSFGQGSTFMELPREKFAMLKISVPPLPEQTAIANYLDEQTAHIDRLSDTVRQTIDRLQEYRSTLITQVVTGKIKVV